MDGSRKGVSAVCVLTFTFIHLSVKCIIVKPYSTGIAGSHVDFVFPCSFIQLCLIG